MPKRVSLAGTCLFLVVAVSAGAGAAEPANGGEAAKTVASCEPLPARSPLAGLPSKPGPHVEQIRDMGPAAWLKLGPPAADPRWGRARGRSWTPQMACAPDLRVAWLYGSGQHGFVKPDGHYQDDLWAYDINAHRWICVWAGTDVKHVRLRLDSRGFEVNHQGEPVPVAQRGGGYARMPYPPTTGHGYQNVAYVAALKKFMSIQSDDPYTSRAIPRRREWHPPRASNCRLGGSPKHLWFYNVTAGKRERRYAEGPGPDQRCESVLEDLPGRS
jgi:hypothetical protein